MTRIQIISSLSLLFSTLFLNAQDKLYPNEFPLGDVQLLEGPFKHARDLNLEVLLKYDVDRLLAPYRKEAGLEMKAKPYPNWDGLDGHVGGHYLSAMAMNYAATGDAECKKRMEYMLSEIKICQDANAVNHPEWGVGYAGGFPNSDKVWSTFKQGDFKTYHSSWAPFYNLHKMYAGLRDAWLYADNPLAKTLFLKFCDWGIDLTAKLTDDQMQDMLRMEHGGMNEIFADAYQMTGDKKYLEAAKRYSHHEVLDPLSEGRDNLDNKHANTQIPKFIGFERIAELSHDEKYHKAGKHFWDVVTEKRSLAFGGNSRKEHFPTIEANIDFVNVNDGPESCNSYNMLKLTEDLFRSKPEAKYADYYERTLYNHILGSQHPEHGGYVYFTPARPRHYRVYSAPNEAMWCCVGTGMENHGKYNQFIYTRNNDQLFVNLFIASTLNWKEKGLKLRQETSFPEEEHTKITITEGNVNLKLKVRYPAWVTENALQISVNGKKIGFTAKPGSYVEIDRKWKKGDVIDIVLPMQNTVEHLPYVDEYVAMMHGPILLGAKTGIEDLKGIIADDGRWGQYSSGKYLPVDQAPILINDDLAHLGHNLKPVPGKPLQYKLDVKMINGQDMTLQPFYQIHDARYMMYWLALTDKGYQTYLDSLSNLERIILALEARTIDKIAPGEQQPETDHDIESERSTKGNKEDDFYRVANNGGFFSYDLNTNNEKDLVLQVRYWGYEFGGRKFDIYIDDQKLVTEDNTNRWLIASFQDVDYQIPNEWLEGKSHVRVKFQALPRNSAGPVYSVRLLRN